ncbi:MAG: archaemetzincin [Desulfobacterales bacterium]
MNTTAPTTIVIAPVGNFDPETVAGIGRGVGRVFRTPVRVEPLISDLTFAFHADRRQYHSTAILRVLAASAPTDALKVLALVRVDLFIPILTHVYGEAQMGGIACVLSTHRLYSVAGSRAGMDEAMARTVKEALHELGHTFGLRHCPDATCLMHYCRSEQDVDLKSSDPCRYCRVLLDDELKKPTKSP